MPTASTLTSCICVSIKAFPNYKPNYSVSADVRWEWVCPVTNHWRRGAHWSRSMGESRRSSPSNPKCGSTQNWGNWGKFVREKKFSGICDLLNEWLIFQTRSVLNICLKEIISYASRSVWAMHICAFTLWEWSNAGLSDFSHQMKLPFVLRTFNPFHSWSSPSDSRFVWSQRLQCQCVLWGWDQRLLGIGDLAGVTGGSLSLRGSVQGPPRPRHHLHLWPWQKQERIPSVFLLTSQSAPTSTTKITICS